METRCGSPSSSTLLARDQRYELMPSHSKESEPVKKAYTTCSHPGRHGIWRRLEGMEMGWVVRLCFSLVQLPLLAGFQLPPQTHLMYLNS
ncbi:hypothetical protein GN956_G20891 [Arapaima gigas]